MPFTTAVAFERCRNTSRSPIYVLECVVTWEAGMNDLLIFVSVLFASLAILAAGAIFFIALILLAAMPPVKLHAALQRFLCRISFDCFGRGGFGQ